MAEAAIFLGISRRSLYNWIEDGKIVSYRDPVSGHRMFKEKDLQKILNNIKKEVKD